MAADVIPFPPRMRPAATGRYQAILDLWNGCNAGAAELTAAAALEYEHLKRALAAEAEATQNPPEAC